MSALEAQLAHTLAQTDLPGVGALYRGKVRDTYAKADRLVLIATDRLSAFDRVLTTIPFKGELLNRLTQFWFEKTASIVRNHVIDVPDPNVTVAHACRPFPVEFVVRGYLTGSLWRAYDAGERGLYGLRLPDGMRKDQAFDTPILTPSTKAPQGQHDAPVSEGEIVASGWMTARQLGEVKAAAMALFAAGQAWARSRGLILVDTKYEFGLKGDDVLLIDELHTPDSSRFWMLDEYEVRLARGFEQQMLDKENIRQWLLKERGFSGHGDAPAIPDDVRVELAQKYLAAYERITGEGLLLAPGDVSSRLVRNLRATGYLQT